MADVDFDFFDEAPPGKGGENDAELSPRTKKHGGQKKIEAKIPTGKTQYSSSDSDSDSPRSNKHKKDEKKSENKNADSSDSDSESGKSDKSKDGVVRNAWGDENKKNGVRPKSGHPSGRSSRHQNRPVNSKQHKSRSNSRSRSRSRSRSGSRSSNSDSDSSAVSSSTEESDDITEVSPLPSPLSTARSNASSRKKPPGGGTPKYGSSRPASRRGDGSNRSRPASATKMDQLLRPDEDAMDLRLLMQAVLEMEKERDREELLLRKPRQPRFSVPGPRPGSAGGGSTAASAQRKNQSFRNEQTRDIDRENTRLMQKIVRYAADAKRKKMQQQQQQQKKRRPQPVVVTTSAVNRRREQERIDRENMAMLRRLEGAKATTTLRKDKLINDFNNHRMAGVPMGAVHPLDRSKSRGGLRSPSPYGDHARSKSNMSDASSVRSSGTLRSPSAGGSRPGSAKGGAPGSSRPQSGKRSRPGSGKMAPASRPDWESGW